LKIKIITNENVLNEFDALLEAGEVTTVLNGHIEVLHFAAL
jgi:hypothetical protein